MKKLKYLFAVGLSLLIFASCKHDDLSMAKPNENVRPAADFVKNNYEMRLFYAALQKVGYVDQLNGTGPFTLLAPTDEAFNNLGIYTAADFDKMNVDSLKKVIGYHVLPRKLRVADIPSNGVDVRYATLEGTALYASAASTNPNGGVLDELYFSGVEATRKDVVLANGTLHVLNQVMKPNFSKTIQQWLAQRAEYSVFVAGLKKFNLWDQLAMQGPFTIFAPDNKAMEDVGITELSLSAMDAGKYMGDLLFGVYILYDRHFFTSDGQVFAGINSNGSYSYYPKNTTYYMTFGAGKMYPSFKLAYSLVLRTGPTSNDPPVAVSSNITVKNDNLCSNGLVHHLVSGLITQEEAIKR